LSILDVRKNQEDLVMADNGKALLEKNKMPTWIEELQKITDTLKPIGYEVIGYKDHAQVGEPANMITVNLKRAQGWKQ
jgi:hypothetical protein